MDCLTGRTVLLKKGLMEMINAKCNVVKIFTGTSDLMYFYKSHSNTSAPYESKTKWVDDKLNETEFAELVSKMIKASSGLQIMIARLEKKAKGVRLRFSNENMPDIDKEQTLNIFIDRLRSITPSYPEKKVSHKASLKNENKKGEKMESFSLTNLKDALVNKITHLDRKTVMILAIIALILLIVGKYQTIKDILIGIKDKIKRSKNFKAMVEDGTNAVNSLKKIIGVKDKGEAANEA